MAGEGELAGKTGAHIIADVIKPLAREAESVGEHAAEDTASSAAKHDAQRSLAKAVDPHTRLGPDVIDRSKAGSDLIPSDYDRFRGSDGPDDFIDQHWNPDAYDKRTNTTGDWRYPDHEGFDTNSPVYDHVEPPVGTRMDRFGSEYGDFTAQPGTPFDQRALPPDSLDKEYHVYKVAKPFDDESGYPRFGRTAPAFGQDGGGMQFKLPRSVKWLRDNGYLEEA